MSNSKTFAAGVMRRLASSDEFDVQPLLEPALRLAAAWAYAKWQRGDYGRSRRGPPRWLRAEGL